MKIHADIRFKNGDINFIDLEVKYDDFSEFIDELMAKWDSFILFNGTLEGKERSYIIAIDQIEYLEFGTQ